MATKKKLLQAAAGTAAASGGAGALNVEDVFSTYLYDGNGESQSIDNGINLGQSNDGGSAHFEPDDSNDTDGIALGSANYITSGDFTIECFVWIEGLNSTNTNGYEIPTIFYFNSPRLSLTYDFVSPGGSADQAFNLFDTTYRFGSINQHPEATYTNTWVHVAVVRNSGTIRCYVDGTEAFNFSNTTDYSGATLTIGNNSNGTPVQGHISNFRVVDGTAVYTSSFTPPTSELTAISGTTLLTFTSENTLTDTSSSSHAFTVTGSVSSSTFGPFDAADAGEGGMTWIKLRNSASNNELYDTERGATYSICSNTTNAAITRSTGLTSFNSNGFTVGSGTNVNANNYDVASWTFRKAPKFFTCLTYTGTGTAQNISHDLGAVPAAIFVKQTSGSTRDWNVYHRGVNGGSNPEGYYLRLQGTEAADANVNKWNNTAPTDTVFTVGTAGSTNGSGETFVAYLFAHNDGDGEFGSTADQDIIKCGSYTGNGSTTGPVIDLGFEPQWIIIKNTSQSHDWEMYDVMRGWTSDGNADQRLEANKSDAEVTTGSSLLKPTATGFALTTTNSGLNASGNNYIYIAIRRGPMAVPTDAADVFDVQTYTGDGTNQLSLENGPLTDFGFFHHRSSANGPYSFTRLTGSERYLRSHSTSAEQGGFGWFFDTMSGMYLDGTASYINGSGANNVFWQWKRAPSFCDVVAYTGNGTAGRTVSHNLGVAPEMMWVKSRTSGATTPEWSVYHKDLGNDKRLVLNTTAAVSGSSATFWYNTTPTETQFYTGSTYVNQSGYNYIAYLFASLDGVSKVGSVNHVNGTRSIVDCGFSNGARFVLFKYADSSTGIGGAPANWHVFDTERGIIGGIDARLSLNTTDAEINTGNDYIDPDSSGFSLPGGHPSGTYIFYAIA